MESITIYSRSTGHLLRQHAGPSGSALLDEDEAAILGECPINSALQIAADDFGDELLSAVRCVPRQPPDVPGHEWTFDDASWSWISTITLKGARAAKWAQLKRARDAVEVAPLTVASRTFDADSESRARISGAALLALLAPAGWSIDWTLADNTVATLSAAELLAVGEALGDQISAAHACSRSLRAQLDAATTVAEINTINWPTP